MPVLIDDCSESIVGLTIAKFQFGQTVEGVIVSNYTTNISITYAEFMQLMYSRTGELVFRPSACQTTDFLLSKYEQCVPTYAFTHENRNLVATDLLASCDLHNLINGPFMAIIEITMISQVLQFGIHNRVVFSVTSAPYKPVLNVCNSHIYEIVIGEERGSGCGC